MPNSNKISACLGMVLTVKIKVQKYGIEVAPSNRDAPIGGGAGDARNTKTNVPDHFLDQQGDQKFVSFVVYDNEDARSEVIHRREQSAFGHEKPLAQ